MKNNNIEDEGLKHLIAGLKENTALTKLNLSSFKYTLNYVFYVFSKDNSITFGIPPELVQVMAENSTIKKLNLNNTENWVRLTLTHFI